MMLRRGGCIYSEEQDCFRKEFLREALVRREDRLRRLNEVLVRGAG